MSLVSHKMGALKWSAFFKSLEVCPYGSLDLKFPDGQMMSFRGDQQGRKADMQIHDKACLDAFISQGDIGLGETYMAGLWETSNLEDLLVYFVENQKAIEDFFHGNKISQFFFALQKLFKKNNRKRSKKNIEEHYDLGNDFYQTWLDPSMTYSSALFADPDCSLEQAQHHKYERIFNQLPCQTQNILEIGCGWGGFLEVAGKKGASIEALTLSPSQAAYAEKRAQQQGLSDHVRIHLKDYRDVSTQYDSIVSIEMMEAVGAQYWSTYFAALKKGLKEGGKAVIQTITIDDALFESYLKRTDFIQKHVFPGGVLPSHKIFNDLARKKGLRVEDAFNFGSCYAKTLRLWLERFDQNDKKIKNIGFSDVFIRKWRFYLSYCVAGFSTKQTDVFQFTLGHQPSS